MKQNVVVLSTAAEDMPLGELKAIQRENHLCLQCTHHVVCKVACAIDPDMLIIIRQCLAFEPAAPAGGKA